MMAGSGAAFSTSATAAARTFDAVVVGGGHNGLVAASYLARAGKKVCVVERRPMLGGAAVTEEIVPGFKFSRASYVYSLFRPQIVRDLDLHRHGLRLLPRSPSSFTPVVGPAGSPSLLLGAGATSDAESIARFSPRDARAYPRYNALMDRYASCFVPLLDRPPPDPGSLSPFSPPQTPGPGTDGGDAGSAGGGGKGGKGGSGGRAGGASDPLRWHRWAANVRDTARAASSVASLGRDIPGMWEVLTAPATKILDRWFESPLLKATLATDAIIGAALSPSSPGSAYVLLHHVMCGTWANVEGGMGALSDAVACAAAEAGAELRVSSPARRIVTEEEWDGARRVRGVEMEDGTFLRSDVVLSAAAPRVTFGKLLGGDDGAGAGAGGGGGGGGGWGGGWGGGSSLSPSLRAASASVTHSSHSMKINLAIDRLPSFTCSPNPRQGGSGGGGGGAMPHHRGTIHFETDPGQIEAAFVDAQRGLPSARPVIEMTLPSVLDPSLAPPGKHVCLLFVQYAPYDVRAWKGPLGWDAPGAREEFASRVFSVIEEYAPGFTASIVGRPDILAPPDLERVFGLPGGNIFHASMGLDQLLWGRPFAGAARHSVAGIRGLYLAGAGSHPGGGVMGAPGRNAAATVLAEMAAARR